MASPDPVRLLQRVAANVGRVPSADLVAQVYEWVAGAAVPILNGTVPAEALGLKAQPGAWQSSPVHRARFDRRDAALRELWNLAEGDDQQRTWQVQEWLYQWQTFTGSRLTGPQVRRLLAAVPADAREHLDVIADTGLRIPEKRAFQRVVRAVSQGMADAGECVSIDLEAPPVAATSNRP